MRLNLFFLIALITFSLKTVSQNKVREVIPLNENWKFINEDLRNAQSPDLDTKNWKTLSIPHDWAFENGVEKNGAQSDKGGYFSGGIGWYRYTFDANSNFKNKQYTIEFDGVYMNSEVWINGHYLGKRPYGYISFRYELSKYLKNGENTIAVRVDNTKEPSARWYHPCGIYAPVRLIIANNTHIAPNGIFVTTPQITPNKALVNIETTIKTSASKTKNLILETLCFNASGSIVAKTEQTISIKTNSETTIKTELEIENPKLWDTQTPNLYSIVSRIKQKHKVIDNTETPFGIRTISWDAQTGFSLNGTQTKLLGVCEHYEGGPFGGAWTKPLMRWKLGLLKEMGVNAIRTAHNPTPPFFYDLCDEMGIMVMDEMFDGWHKKAPEDYGKQAFAQWWQQDVYEWLTRDRNHPSIVIYSVGNETRGEIGKDIVEYCHSMDRTRPITSGHSASEYMDVYGVNGHSERTDFYTHERPNKAFVATEAPHTWQTRGYYRSKTWFRDGFGSKVSAFTLPDLTKTEIFNYEWAKKSKWANQKQHFNSSYDNATVRISARKNWEIMRDSAWYSGHFRWTGFDYYGEAGYVHGGWPFRLFMGGALDVAGFKKDLFYFYQSQWTKQPMVHILPHWTHPLMAANTQVPVWVYSNCDEVELFLNGKSLGKDKPGKKWNEMQCEWLVPYKPGTLTAKGYINGKLVAQTHQTTAGVPSAIGMGLNNNYVSPEKDNIAIVTTQITDDQSVLYPYGENTVYYHITGPAKILSLENGDPVDTTKNVGIAQKKAFMGLTNAFIKLDNSNTPVTLINGAIVGEKQLLTSNKVAIAVKQLNLRGETVPGNFKIYYTTDNSTPTTKSNAYTAPFIIAPETTVKAIVVLNTEVVLNMEENFGKNLGLYWFNEEEETAAQNPQGMKSVNASYKGAAPAEINKQSYLKFTEPDGFIKWYQENDGSADTFILSFYVENPKTVCTLPLYINNRNVKNLVVSPKATINNWQIISTKQPLNAGANDIELRNSNNCNIGVYMLEVKLTE